MANSVLETTFNIEKRSKNRTKSTFCLDIAFHSSKTCYNQEWYFVTKIVLTYCEKKNSSDREKLSRLKAENFQKKFEITRTIYSNSVKSEQILVTECFFNLFLEVSQI